MDGRLTPLPADTPPHVRYALLTSLYSPRAARAGVFRCKMCRHRFREVYDHQQFAFRIVAPIGRYNYETACVRCRLRLRFLKADTRGALDSGVRLPGINDA